MNKNLPEDIRAAIASYAHTSFEHLTSDDLEETEIVSSKHGPFLMMGLSGEDGCKTVHWAADDVDDLIVALHALKQSIRISFVPEAWKDALIEAGFQIESVLGDHWRCDMQDCDAWESSCRPAKAAEIPVISAISNACAGRSRGFTGRPSEAYAAWMAGHDPHAIAVHATDTQILVCRDTEEVVGYVCVACYGKDERKTVWIRELAVKPEKQHQGHGRHLFESALKYGCVRGAERAFLMADEQNKNALNLYGDYGFHRKDDTTEIVMTYRP